MVSRVLTISKQRIKKSESGGLDGGQKRFKGSYYINLLYLGLTQELGSRYLNLKWEDVQLRDKKMIGLENREKWGKISLIH